jgi:uncharacterized protein (TIGR02271 family)
MMVPMNEESITVVDQAGVHGLVDPAQFTSADEGGVWVRFADRQVLVPVEMLVAQANGTFYLPLSLAELARQTEQAVNQAGISVVLPVIQEELLVQKRPIETGVRVSKVVHEQQETYDLPLVSEEIEIRRIPVNRRVDQPVPIRQEGDVLVVPVLEEVLVVQKQLLLKEEVHIITKRTETHKSGQETLRREEVLVEPIQGEASPQMGSQVPLQHGAETISQA